MSFLLELGGKYNSLFLQVVETVRVFVSDANDESPEFLNLPFIIDIPEVQNTF